MSNLPNIPILSEIVPTGLAYGSAYVILSEPESIWYEMSLTIAAQALRNGVRTEYHAFQHPPQDVRRGLSRLGVDAKQLEGRHLFRILDTCTQLTGLPFQPEPLPYEHPVPQIGYKFNDPSNLDVWTAVLAKIIGEGCPESEKRWLHIDDNTSIFNRYFREKDLINIFENRFIPYFRLTERVVLHSLLTRVASEIFYKQFLAQCDGILDLKSPEEDGRIEHYVRVRSMRGMACDSRWRHLRLLAKGEVSFDPRPSKQKEVGITKWLRGPGGR